MSHRQAAESVVSYEYDAWGKVYSVTGSLADTLGTINPIRYRSYYYDTETGFYYLNSRYYDPEIKRFINADNQLNPDIQTGKNLYSYCFNNPTIQDDPSGQWALIDDLIAGAVGAIVGVGGQFISDLVTSAVNGQWTFSSWEQYVGAGVGGAVGGVVSLYATPVVGSAVSSGVSTVVGQGLEKLTGKNDRPIAEIAVNTAVNTTVGAAFGKVSVKIPKITSGRNSFSSVYNSGLTKLGNKTATTMSAKVITKGIIAGIAGDIHIDLYNGLIPGAEYWYDGVGMSNGGRGTYMCSYNGHLYTVDGNFYGEVFE